MSTTEHTPRDTKQMTSTAGTRIYNVCREATRELVMRVEAESDYEARYLVTRLTSWSFDGLTTRVKPLNVEVVL